MLYASKAPVRSVSSTYAESNISVLALASSSAHTAAVQDRLGPFETLGAWLRLWTPPRGVTVPPIPSKAIAGGAALLIVGVSVTASLVLPRLASDREAARERRQAIDAKRRTSFLASVDREQRPRSGRGHRDPRSDEATRRNVRTALVSTAQGDIERDTSERSSKRILGVECEPFPRSLDVVPPLELRRRAAAYECVAVTSRFGRGTAAGGIIGLPFRLIVHFDSGRFAWCRIVPLGDRDRLTKPLPDACRL